MRSEIALYVFISEEAVAALALLDLLFPQVIAQNYHDLHLQKFCQRQTNVQFSFYHVQLLQLAFRVVLVIREGEASPQSPFLQLSSYLPPVKLRQSNFQQKISYLFQHFEIL